MPSADVQCRSEAPPTAVVLAETLGIEQAAQLKSTLLAALAAPGVLTLDGSAVRELHTAPLELLVLFWRERRQLGRETRWQSPSAALREAATQLGITALLGLNPTGEPA